MQHHLHQISSGFGYSHHSGILPITLNAIKNFTATGEKLLPPTTLTGSAPIELDDDVVEALLANVTVISCGGTVMKTVWVGDCSSFSLGDLIDSVCVSVKIVKVVLVNDRFEVVCVVRDEVDFDADS